MFVDIFLYCLKFEEIVIYVISMDEIFLFLVDFDLVVELVVMLVEEICGRSF